MNLPHTEVKFYPGVKSQTGLSSRRVSCKRAHIHCIMPTKNSEAATRGVLQKRVFLETSQNSQENTCARDSFLIKLQA